MIPGIVEYVSLRLARRFLFTEALLTRSGNLPLWRPNDHLRIFREHAFATEVLTHENAASEFLKMRDFIADRFDRDDPETAATRAAIAVFEGHSTMGRI